MGGYILRRLTQSAVLLFAVAAFGVLQTNGLTRLNLRIKGQAMEYQPGAAVRLEMEMEIPGLNYMAESDGDRPTNHECTDSPLQRDFRAAQSRHRCTSWSGRVDHQVCS